MIPLFLLLCFFLLIIIIRSEYEKKHIVKRYFSIYSAKIKKSLRCVFISDTHERPYEDFENLILKENPDLVIIGGDYSVTGRKKTKFVNSIRLFRALKKDFRGDLISSFGNHEERLKKYFPEEYMHLYEEIKDTLLQNNTSLLSSLKRKGIRIRELKLSEEYYKSPIPDTESLIEKFKKDLMEDQGLFTISLLHTPRYYKEAVISGADLVLSGHYHGGIVNIPNIGALMTPHKEMFVREAQGRFNYKGSTLIVSSGLGTHSVNIRINARPDIIVIDLFPEN